VDIGLDQPWLPRDGALGRACIRCFACSQRDGLGGVKAVPAAKAERASLGFVSTLTSQIASFIFGRLASIPLDRSLTAEKLARLSDAAALHCIHLPVSAKLCPARIATLITHRH
jgi:hypothetical protein